MIKINLIFYKYLSVLIIVEKSQCKERLANKDNIITEIEEYTKEEYEIISF